MFFTFRFQVKWILEMLEADCGSCLQFGLSCWLIGNQSAADAGLIKALSWEWAEAQVCGVCVCVCEWVIKMFTNRTLVSLFMADPWCFWGKPTGSGPRAVTLIYKPNAYQPPQDPTRLILPNKRPRSMKLRFCYTFHPSVAIHLSCRLCYALFTQHVWTSS